MPRCVPPVPPRSHTGGVAARSRVGSSPMLEEVAEVWATGDTASRSVSLELGSAVVGWLGHGPEGSSSSWREEETGRSQDRERTHAIMPRLIPRLCSCKLPGQFPP